MKLLNEYEGFPKRAIARLKLKNNMIICGHSENYVFQSKICQSYKNKSCDKK
jgi:hypothetical protein